MNENQHKTERHILLLIAQRPLSHERLFHDHDDHDDDHHHDHHHDHHNHNHNTVESCYLELGYLESRVISN